MAQSANLNVRTDVAIKEQSEEIFSEMGLSLSAAINIFLRQVVREQRIPFEITLNTPNKTTLAAFREGKRLLGDPAAPSYSDMSSLRKALDA